jgi:hypothetical protein
MRRGFLIISGIVPILSGCQMPAPEPVPTVVTTPPPALETPSTEMTTNPVETPPHSPVKQPLTKAVTPKAAVKPPGSPEELVGLDRDGVVRLLGDPAGSHTEGGATVLNWRGKDCGLDVIFFLDLKTGILRVLSFDLQQGDKSHAKNCYEMLRSGK